MKNSLKLSAVGLINIFKTKKKESSKGSVREFIGKLSKGLMLPISVLPIAGLFLGIGAAISSNAGSNIALKIFGDFLSAPGGAIFGSLPLLFAIAIAIAFTNDAGPSALTALVGFLVFSSLQAALSKEIIIKNEIKGYELLFYTKALVGNSFNSNGGLPASLFGSVIGIRQLQSSVFGGLLVGFISAYLFNKFKYTKLPDWLGFFNGIRFVIVITFISFFPITLAFLIIWPLIGILLSIIGGALGQAIGFNSFAFGFIERALVPFGLHHAFYSPLWYTDAGGSVDLTAPAIINYKNIEYGLSSQLINDNNTNVVSWKDLIVNLGQDASKGKSSIGGDQSLWAYFNENLLGKKVYLYKIVDKETTTLGINSFISSAKYASLSSKELHTIGWNDLTSGFQALNSKGANAFFGVNIGQYMQGKYVFMIFGLPAAGAAMVMAAPKQNRKQAISIIASASFTSFLTGITEPIEFTFLFLAPWLFWGVHALLCALAFGLMNWIGIIMIANGSGHLAPHIGQSFSGGILDWIIYGAIQLPFGSNAWWSLIFGLAYAPIYYFLFKFLIKKYNIQTPGRSGENKLYTKADYLEKKSNNSKLSNLSDQHLTSIEIIKAYGGLDNIKNVDACITKLRVEVENQDLVNIPRLTELGAQGVIKPSAKSAYAIYGTKADYYKGFINEIISNINKDPSLKDVYFSSENNQESSLNNSNNSIHNTVLNQTNDLKNEMENEKLIIYSPVDGTIVPMSKVPDETFSKEIIGKGIAIKPKNSKFVSPINGKLSLVFDTGHAYSFESKKGSQILIHIGIDSINIVDENGNKLNPFVSKVKTGDKVKVGDEIANVKINDLKKAKSAITPIILMNESIANRKVKILKTSGTVQKGTPIFEIIPDKK